MMRRGLATVALALVGCVKIAPFQQKDAGTEPGSEAGVDAGPQTSCDPSATSISHFMEFGHEVVCGPNYAMRFSSDGVHYPYNFHIGGRQLLGTGDADCHDERGVGIGVYPAGIVNGEPPPQSPETITSESGTLAYQIDGPYVTKVTLDWSTAFNTCNLELEGHSTFSFFRDGRISRFDEVHQISSGMLGASACAACQPPANNWKLTSYLVFATNTITPTFANPPTNETSSNSTNSESGGEGYFCATGASDPFRLGVGWGESGNRIRSPSLDGPVATHTTAIVHDMIPSDTVMDIMGFVGQTQTTMLVRPMTSTCTDVRTELLKHTRRDRIIAVTNGVDPLAIPIAADGIYGGEYDARQRGAGFTTGPDQLDLSPMTTAIPAGFALWFNFTGSYTAFTVLKDVGDTVLRPIDADGFGVQLVESTTGTSAVFWFRDALSAQQHISIVPVPP